MYLFRIRLIKVFPPVNVLVMPRNVGSKCRERQMHKQDVRGNREAVCDTDLGASMFTGAAWAAQGLSLYTFNYVLVLIYICSPVRG